MTDIVSCAWCDAMALGWAAVEAGFPVANPSCGQHGADYRPDPVLFDAWLADHDLKVVTAYEEQRKTAMTIENINGQAASNVARTIWDDGHRAGWKDAVAAEIANDKGEQEPDETPNPYEAGATDEPAT